MGGKPSRGTPRDKRLGVNKKPPPKPVPKPPFRGAAKPFGGRKR